MSGLGNNSQTYEDVYQNQNFENETVNEDFDYFNDSQQSTLQKQNLKDDIKGTVDIGNSLQNNSLQNTIKEVETVVNKISQNQPQQQIRTNNMIPQIAISKLPTQQTNIFNKIPNVNNITQQINNINRTSSSQINQIVNMPQIRVPTTNSVVNFSNTQQWNNRPQSTQNTIQTQIIQPVTISPVPRHLVPQELSAEDQKWHLQLFSWWIIQKGAIQTLQNRKIFSQEELDIMPVFQRFVNDPRMRIEEITIPFIGQKMINLAWLYRRIISCGGYYFKSQNSNSPTNSTQQTSPQIQPPPPPPPPPPTQTQTQTTQQITTTTTITNNNTTIMQNQMQKSQIIKPNQPGFPIPFLQQQQQQGIGNFQPQIQSITKIQNQNPHSKKISSSNLKEEEEEYDFENDSEDEYDDLDGPGKKTRMLKLLNKRMEEESPIIKWKFALKDCNFGDPQTSDDIFIVRKSFFDFLLDYQNASFPALKKEDKMKGNGNIMRSLNLQKNTRNKKKNKYMDIDEEVSLDIPPFIDTTDSPSLKYVSLLLTNKKNPEKVLSLEAKIFDNSVGKECVKCGNIEFMPMTMYNDVFYFRCPYNCSSKSIQDELKDKGRQWLEQGEICLWAGGQSILIGYAFQKKNVKENSEDRKIFHLLEDCLVFGHLIIPKEESIESYYQKYNDFVVESGGDLVVSLGDHQAITSKKYDPQQQTTLKRARPRENPKENEIEKKIKISGNQEEVITREPFTAISSSFSQNTRDLKKNSDDSNGNKKVFFLKYKYDGEDNTEFRLIKKEFESLVISKKDVLDWLNEDGASISQIVEIRYYTFFRDNDVEGWSKMKDDFQLNLVNIKDFALSLRLMLDAKLPKLPYVSEKQEMPKKELKDEAAPSEKKQN